MATRWRRRRALAALALGVALFHALVVAEFADRLALFGDRAGPNVQRMEVAFVRELAPKDEPLVAPAAPVSVARAATLAAEQAASAPVKLAARKPAAKKPPKKAPEAASAPSASPAVPQPPTETTVTASVAAPTPAESTVPPPDVSPPAASASDSVPRPTGVAALAPAGATATAPQAAASSARAGFEWPPSTQLRYVLKGNYRGEVEGSARVQWVRQGPRYQVQLDVAIGPSFAPLMARSMVSEGEVSDQGLAPRRYEERTRIGFSSRQLSMSFDRDRAQLANGSSVPAPRGMQDASSQFVQLSYLFTMNPGLLKPGGTVAFPVALPRRVDQWTYDVVGEEILATPMGDLKTFHLRPRRDSPRQGELVAQAWYAPSLQYLPVRILIHQDAETFIDMLLERAPMQAEPATN